MKIAFFTENYRRGGVDTFLISLLNNWPDKSDKLHLIINKSHSGLEYLKNNLDDNVEVTEHDFFTYKKLTPRISNFNTYIRLFLLGVAKFISYPLLTIQTRVLFKKHKFDHLLVINGGFPAGETCICASIAWYLATGRKSWHNFHNYAFPYNSIFYPLQFIHDLIFKRTVEGMISVSNDCAHSITARNGLNGVKTKFIYNGLNIHPVNRTSNIRTELSISSDAKVIIMLATYEERKGHSFLFEAFELFKENNVHLIICGTGSLAEKEVMSFNKREVSNHTNIHILGHRDDSYELISQSDLVVIPSKSHESFGLTIIEAMALKVPVISTSVGGMPEVIENGVSGFTVKYGDTNGFYKKMKKALFDMELKSNLVVSGVERYKSMFTANVMAESYAKLIKEKK